MTGHAAETPKVTVPAAPAADEVLTRRSSARDWVGDTSMATLEEVERVVADDARVRR